MNGGFRRCFQACRWVSRWNDNFECVAGVVSELFKDTGPFGLRQDAAVKQAARRKGMTIGAWVNDTLHKAAVEDITGQSTLPAHRVEEQLEAITAKLNHLNRPFWERLFKR